MSRAVIVAAVIAAGAAAAAAPAGGARAAAGSLDRTFGGAGAVTHRDGVARGMVIAPDGRIVTVGNGYVHKRLSFELRRYRPDGRIDTSFSRDGVARTEFARSSNCGGAAAIALQANGKLVAAGRSGCTGGRFAIARFLRDGRLDRSFSGDGKLTTRLGTRCRFSEADAVAIAPGGAIVAAGRAGCTTPRGFEVTFAVVRYRPDGRLDRGFGSEGRVTSDFTPGWDVAADVLVTPSGAIVVAGTADEDHATPQGEALWRMAVARYRPDGAPDESFGSGGKATIDFAGEDGCGPAEGRALVRQRDGRIVVAGTTGCGQPTFGLARLLPNGSLDPTFSGNGRVATLFPEGGSCLVPTLTDLAIQPDGKLVAVGNAGCKNPHPRFALARYRADGSLDASFGGDGTVTTRLCPARKPIDESIEELDAVGVHRGRIVAAGFSCRGFTLVRYVAG